MLWVCFLVVVFVCWFGRFVLTIYSEVNYRLFVCVCLLVVLLVLGVSVCFICCLCWIVVVCFVLWINLFVVWGARLSLTGMVVYWLCFVELIRLFGLLIVVGFAFGLDLYCPFSIGFDCVLCLTRVWLLFNCLFAGWVVDLFDYFDCSLLFLVYLVVDCCFGLLFDLFDGFTLLVFVDYCVVY